MNNIELLIVISEITNIKKIKIVLESYKIGCKFQFIGEGTASGSMLSYFGLVEAPKVVLFAIIPDYLKKKIAVDLNRMLKLKKLGQGLGFIVPISSSNKFLADEFEYVEGTKEDFDLKTKENEEEFELVVTIILEGYIEKAMAAAKKAGATGGTVISGKGMGGRHSRKMFGFSVEPGREMILMAVKKENKDAIMKAITEEVGIKTEGMGLCFSLPIDSVIGFD